MLGTKLIRMMILSKDGLRRQAMAPWEPVCFGMEHGELKMAIRERVLNQLATMEQDLDHAWKTGEAGAWDAALQRMKDTRNLCQQGLPTSAYSVYGEICDGMVLALEKTIENGLENVQEDVVFLLFELVRHIKEQAGNEQHFKKEIFFLPYKVSMWDSLESVWKAADEDREHCIAYVLPIPYCDRNPDGTAGEWHCERAEFPKNVPTLDWQTVDLKAWHPDVIFFHNPYDEFNKVTSVDFHYYSRTLKECTDKLVYIPYFVLGEPEFGDKSEEEIREMEEAFEHFVLTPGVFNAHQTIVQSEAMRRVYIDVLARGTNVTDRAFWEERILGLGSPKFDKVAESKKEDYELPEEWAKIIRGRKTILYNTGLTAMLEHKEKYLDKIRSVLETFKAQEDVVLWWRPHPLLRSTFQSMHPELLGEYDEIVSAYRQESWGIYDDTPELERAIACTDGYYGDWSSVVQLYEKTGKKVFIQNCSGEYGEPRRFNGNTHFMDVAHHGGYVYFSETSFNGLFRCKEGETQAEFLGRFPGEDLWQGDLHRNVFVRGDKLYFIPLNGHGIAVYDCRNGAFKLLTIPECHKKHVHYVQCVEIGREIMLIPVNLDTPFVLFDLEDEGIRIIHGLAEKIAIFIPQPTRYGVFSAYGSTVIKNTLYLAVECTNVILKISLCNYDVSCRVLPFEIHVRYMNCIGSCLCFTAMEHVVATWNFKTGNYKVYDIPYEVMEENYPYLHVVESGSDLLIIPGREDRFWKLNPTEEKWTNLSYKFPDGFERDFRGPLLFLGYDLREDEKLILYPRAGNGILVYDMNMESFVLNSIHYTDDLGRKLNDGYKRNIVSENDLLFEGVLSISAFIDFYKNNSSDRLSGASSESFGKKIYGDVLETYMRD